MSKTILWLSARVLIGLGVSAAGFYAIDECLRCNSATGVQKSTICFLAICSLLAFFIWTVLRPFSHGVQRNSASPVDKHFLAAAKEWPVLSATRFWCLIALTLIGAALLVLSSPTAIPVAFLLQVSTILSLDVSFPKALRRLRRALEGDQKVGGTWRWIYVTATVTLVSTTVVCVLTSSQIESNPLLALVCGALGAIGAASCWYLAGYERGGGNQKLQSLFARAHVQQSAARDRVRKRGA